MGDLLRRWAFRSWQREIGRWVRRTFPLGSVHTELSHLREEVCELEDAVRQWSDHGAYHKCVREELADVALLCFGLAEYLGCDLYGEMSKKHAVNQTRTFGPNPDGPMHWKALPDD